MPEMLGGSRVSITTGTIIRFFLIGILVLSLYFLFDIVMVVLAAIVIASAIEPVIRRMRHYLRIPRIASVILLYVVMFALLVGFLALFLPLVISDLTGFLQTLPGTISLGDLWGPVQDLGFNLGSAADMLSESSISIVDFVESLKTIVIGTSTGALETASILFGGALSFIIIIVLAFYFSLQEEGVSDFLRIVTPNKKQDYIIGLWKRSQRKIGLWLQGQIVLGIIVGILVYLVLKFFGIPYALALAVLAGLFEIIPVFGPIISAIPAVLIALSLQGVTSALIITSLYVLINQLESHIFYPLVVKKVVGVNPIIVILALIIGAKLAGILGAIIAVPLAAAVLEYVNDVEKDKKAEKDSPRTHQFLKD